MMTENEEKLILDYMIYGNNTGTLPAPEAVVLLSHLDGGDIIDVILDNRDSLRPIITDEIPQFSNEDDVDNVLRVLIESGLQDLTYEQIGEYLCPVDAKRTARRKYGENHYKYACRLGLTTKERPFTATEMGVAYHDLKSNKEQRELMYRLVFSIPFVQHAIVKAAGGHYYMPDFLREFLSPSTTARRRSNMHKIMSWAYDVTSGRHRELFDNIAWY